MDFQLDITHEVCPMTFVRTKLLLEKMAVGQTATIRLRGEEPWANVPRSVRDLGHRLLDLRDLGDETYEFDVQKA